MKYTRPGTVKRVKKVAVFVKLLIFLHIISDIKAPTTAPTPQHNPNTKY